MHETRYAPFNFVAVVHGRDGVRFTANAPTRAALVSTLGDYVRRHARHQLWEAGSELVLALLARGNTEQAVETYFRLVGSRWDEEWLVTTRLSAVPEAGRDTSASVGAVVGPRSEGQPAREQSRPLRLESETQRMTQPLEQST